MYGFVFSFSSSPSCISSPSDGELPDPFHCLLVELDHIDDAELHSVIRSAHGDINPGTSNALLDPRLEERERFGHVLFGRELALCIVDEGVEVVVESLELLLGLEEEEFVCDENDASPGGEDAAESGMGELFGDIGEEPCLRIAFVGLERLVSHPLRDERLHEATSVVFAEMFLRLKSAGSNTFLPEANKCKPTGKCAAHYAKNVVMMHKLRINSLLMLMRHPLLESDDTFLYQESSSRRITLLFRYRLMFLRGNKAVLPRAETQREVSCLSSGDDPRNVFPNVTSEERAILEQRRN